MSTLQKIMEIVEEYESQDKSPMIEDLLIMLGDDIQVEILTKLQNHQPLR